MTKAVIIAISGPPGSGKTTLAAALAQQIHVPWISRDVIKQGMVWPHGFVSDDPHIQNSTCNQAFEHSIVQLTRHGVSVIADAAFQHALWHSIIPVWQRTARVLVIHCHIEESLRLRRLAERLHTEPHRRQAHADDAYLAQRAPQPAFQYYQSTDAMLDIDTDAPLTALVQSTVTWIEHHCD